jgi:uncharacterized protein (TIGR03437 family)
MLLVVKKVVETLLGLLLVAVVAAAQPSLSGIVNAASNVPIRLPNAPIAQGALFVIYGSGLGPATMVQSAAFPIPVTLSGTSVQIVLNGAAVSAPVVYTSSGQLAAIMPSHTPVGFGQVTVTYNGVTSASIGVFVTTSNVGVFTTSQNGSGVGVITDANYKLFSEGAAANPGQDIIIWGTGLGAVPDDAALPTPLNRTDVPLEVYIGGKLATVNYRGRSGCCAGLDQIVAIVPEGVQGCATPVVLKIGNFVSNTTTLSVAASGRVCQPNVSGVDFPNLLAQPGISLARLALNRAVSLPDNTRNDTGTGSFLGEGIGPSISLDRLFDHGQTGTCIAGVGSFSLVRGLDPGATITIQGPAGTRTIKGGPFFSAILGDGTPGNFLDPGSYTISGAGGADVGSFTANLTMPPALTWTNQSSLTQVDRTKGLTVTWSGGDPNGIVTISGSSPLTVAPDSFTVSFSCTERTDAGTFTVPPFVLLALPPSPEINAGFGGNHPVPGPLSVGTTTPLTTFKANGLDLGVATASYVNNAQVFYQ